MGLLVYIGKEQASRQYEIEFFQEFASNLTAFFEQRGFEGVLLGHPESKDDEYLMMDCLLITRNVALIIDFKNYDLSIYLPEERDFKNVVWKTNIPDKEVMGGSSINPFVQLEKQKKRLETIIQKSIKSRFDTISTCVLFQANADIHGEIPGRYQKHFSVANIYTYLNKIEASINLRSNVQISPKDLKNRFNVAKYTEIIPIDLKKYTDLVNANKIKEEALAAKERAENIAREAEKKYQEAVKSGIELEKSKAAFEKAQIEAEVAKKKADEKQAIFNDKKHILELAWVEAKKEEEKTKQLKEKTKQLIIVMVAMIALIIPVVAMLVFSSKSNREVKQAEQLRYQEESKVVNTSPLTVKSTATNNSVENRAEITVNDDSYISASQAKNHMYANNTVCDRVAEVKSFSKGVFINFGATYPNEEFSVVIWDESLRSIGENYISSLDGNYACVKGYISEYQGKPRIQVDERKQIWKK